MDDKFKLHLFNRLNYKYNSGIPLLDPICNAPFTNMLFVPSGKVMACHYNRGKVMGDICETTLEEIWNSNNYNELRHKISHNNFSFGCQNCFYELKNKNYFLSGTYKYNHVKRRADHMPVLFDFQLENTCNLECIMCSSEYSSTIQTHRENQLKSDSPYNENFLQQITQFIPHLKAASCTGGEPFIIKIYRELWKLFISTNPTIPLYVSTNASYIPDSVKPILEEGNFNFTVSID
jgi:radical SAM protein with 4Fe4S-binding SPASM domain